MQYRHERGQSEPAGTSKLAKRRTVATNKMKRLMYNRSVRGQSEPDTSKPAKRRTVTSMNCSDLCSIGMEEGNLSPPVLAKNKGTEVFRLVSAAKAKLAGACPIPCLYCIGANAFD